MRCLADSLETKAVVEEIEAEAGVDQLEGVDEDHGEGNQKFRS